MAIPAILDPTIVKKASEKELKEQQQSLKDFANVIGQQMPTEFQADKITTQAPTQAADVSVSKITAPTVNMPKPITTQQGSVNNQERVTIQQPTDMLVTQVEKSSDAVAANIADSAKITAPTLGQGTQLKQTQIAELERMQAAQMSREDIEFRKRQLELANMLQAQASGQGPSLAQNQLQQANEQALKQQMALAASQRGGNLQMAQRQAAINIGDLQQQNALQSAQLAMQEQMAARQQLEGILGSARGQDIAVDTTQTGFEQQSEMVNKQASDQRVLQQAQMSQATDFKQADIDETRALTQAEIDIRTNIANAEAENSRLLANAGFQQDINKLNKMSDDEYNALVANFINDAVKTNKFSAEKAAEIQAELDSRRIAQDQALQTDMVKFNISTRLQRDQFNSESEYRAALANAQMQLDAAKTSAMLKLQADTTNQAAKNEMERFAADAKLRTDIANQAAALQAQGMSLQAISQKLGLQADTLKAINQIEQSLFQAESDRQKTISEKRSGVLGSLMNAAGSVMTSDRNKKANIKKADNQIDDFLAALQSYEFEYKDKPNVKYIGIMAQDLEKSTAGKTAVKLAEDGTKVVGIPEGLGLAFAAIAKLSKDIKGKK